MKKIVCLLFISMSIFLFGCNSEKLQEKQDIQENNVNVNNVEETKTEKTPIRKTDTDPEKQKVLDILYEKTIDEIKRYYGTLIFLPTSTITLIYPDDLKNSISTGFFQKYFSDDIEMQEKLSQLPINTKYLIYERIKEGIETQKVLDILYEKTIDEIVRYYGTLIFLPTSTITLIYPDDLKNSISTGFFQKYFSDDIEMQEKLSQLPINTKYVIYKKLSK